MSFDEEKPIHRQGACDINVFVDHNDINARQKPATETGLVPFYPSSTRRDLYNIHKGEVIHRKKNNPMETGSVLCSSGFAGAGAEPHAMYPNDPEMIKAAIKAGVDIVGIANTDYNYATDAADQGFVAAVFGSHTTDKLVNKTFEPGQIVRAELPDDDPSVAINGKTSVGGRPLAKYQWRVVPEDYSTPGNLILTHMNHMLEDDVTWRKAMGGRTLEVDKWLASCSGVIDSYLQGSLLTIYVLMKKGYLASTDPSATQDPYQAPNIVQNKGDGITANMSPDNFVVRMAELLQIQRPSGASDPIPQSDANYYSMLRRTIARSIFYNGTARTFEFGQKELRNTQIPTRDPRTGVIDKTTREGMFLHNQLNHYRKATGLTLQALDDHTRFRIGRVISGPHRKKLIDVVLERSFM